MFYDEQGKHACTKKEKQSVPCHQESREEQPESTAYKEQEAKRESKKVDFKLEYGYYVKEIPKRKGTCI